MLSSFLILAAAAGLAQAKSDPCTTAPASQWVSSKIAHAYELNVHFENTRSSAVIDSNIKALPWYSLETWFQHWHNPLIPHNVSIGARLRAVQHKTSTSGYKTDWDFNIAKMGSAQVFGQLNKIVKPAKSIPPELQSITTKCCASMLFRHNWGAGKTCLVLESYSMLPQKAHAQIGEESSTIAAELSMNFRNVISYVDKENGILEYVWEQRTRKYQFTKGMFNKPQELWEFVAEEFFGKA
ncbi:hypothetical protein DFH09DRAFT_1089106 [Mycena vulgaris]|nr:hypothetical protein DFH09DRAFT_1089106 [Mycena vulgaris]